ncbi:MAG: LysM peptidoglycan-binding domain-containing protein [Ardenticatenia bacterium]|nr:LysM peptidoglycan-binding domain-containing protein [Ardenticatenia bacterium]
MRPPTDTPWPTDTPAPTHTVRPRPDPVQTIHVVQPGETLSEIAEQYGVSVDALTAANGIADPHLIKIGQELIIPGPASATP